MEMAIETMNASRQEKRRDKKASPSVGAILRRPDGSTESASRGELREGDHAEFTLLERKNRDARLDDCVLFCTLEPCAPGSRNPPKLSCAERIVLARIRRVWIGITDPDPTVDRKGIRYLQENGVQVQMFDRDLQEQIRLANQDFIEQAEQRARQAKQERPSQSASLSRWETALHTTQFRDLDPVALEQYRRVAGIADPITSAPFGRRLQQLGLLQPVRGRLAPTGFGLILFGKEPRVRIPQAGLLATLHHPDGTEETRDFEGPAIDVPRQALDWLRAKLPNPITRTQARRGEANATLFELLREGIVNALVHRDYDITGAKCQLEVHPGKIVVRSPGGPVAPITMEQMRGFDAPMLSRNPVLHYVFAKLLLAEERGLGLKSMRAKASAAGLPLPSYAYREPYMSLTLFREATAALPTRGSKGALHLSAKEQTGWNWLVTRESVTVRDYMQAMQMPARTAKYQLRRMTQLGLLRRAGAGRNTHYEVLRR
jgi:ATP-dependent DNA helicase RecG